MRTKSSDRRKVIAVIVTDLPNENIAFLLDHYEMHGLVLVLSEKRMRYEMQKHVGEQSASLDNK